MATLGICLKRSTPRHAIVAARWANNDETIRRPFSLITRSLSFAPEQQPEIKYAFGRQSCPLSITSTIKQRLHGTSTMKRAFTNIHQPDPYFMLTRISYKMGTFETVNMQASQLLKFTSLYARDLITLNLTSRQERHRRLRAVRAMTAIVPRETVIILSFGFVRAVIGLDQVFLLNAHNVVIHDFAKELADVFRTGDLHGEPPELVILERILRDTVDSFNRRLRLYEPIVDSFLGKIANEVYSDIEIHKLMPLNDSLQSFEIEVKQSIDCLTRLLNNDDEMLALLLTEKAEAAKAGRQVAFARHEHVELLLGVYARQLNNIALDISYLLGRIESKQEFVALSLAGYRNRLIRINVHIGIVGLALSLCTTIAGFYGMNLISGFEQHASAFYYVVMGSGLGGIVVAGTSFHYLSGSTMKKKASQRLGEIETLYRALSDPSAVDYTLKSALDRGMVMDKEGFRKILLRAKASKEVTDEEIDLLFDVFDRTKDGYIGIDDFTPPNGTNGHRKRF